MNIWNSPICSCWIGFTDFRYTRLPFGFQVCPYLNSWTPFLLVVRVERSGLRDLSSVEFDLYQQFAIQIHPAKFPGGNANMVRPEISLVPIWKSNECIGEQVWVAIPWVIRKVKKINGAAEKEPGSSSAWNVDFVPSSSFHPIEFPHLTPKIRSYPKTANEWVDPGQRGSCRH